MLGWGRLTGAGGALKIAIKQCEGADHRVGPLEGLWWAEHMRDFRVDCKADWDWTMMIAQPDEVTSDRFEQVRAEVAALAELESVLMTGHALSLKEEHIEQAAPTMQITVQGMFPIVPPFLPNGPSIVLYPDGVVVFTDQSKFDAGLLVQPYRIGHIDSAKLTFVVARADVAGLLVGDAAYARPVGVSDPPRTTLVLTVAGVVFTHVADGLTESDHDARRCALRSFVDHAVALTVGLESEPYKPARIDVVAAAVDTIASAVDWPDDTVDLAAAGSRTVIDDPASVDVLRSARRGMGFRQAGLTYRLAARVAAPGMV